MLDTWWVGALVGAVLGAGIFLIIFAARQAQKHFERARKKRAEEEYQRTLLYETQRLKRQKELQERIMDHRHRVLPRNPPPSHVRVVRTSDPVPRPKDDGFDPLLAGAIGLAVGVAMSHSIDSSAAESPSSDNSFSGGGGDSGGGGASSSGWDSGSQ